MLKIDNSLLEEVGLGAMPESEKNGFLKHIYETLEMRVGIRLADQMSNEQLDEFERYFEAKDDAGAFKWLETNFPNYKDIVQEEFDKLKGEVAQTAPQILAASQAQANAAPAAQAAVPPPQPSPIAPQQPPIPAAPYQPQPPQPPVPPPNPQPANPASPPPPPAEPPLPYVPPTPTSPAPAPQPPLPTPPEPPQPPPSFNPSPDQPPFPEQQPPAGPSQV
ncbi:MAG TPA: DUF5663 domain-containing protein [Candidatus Saccharimonadales bacterium]|jgi:hypothetical protein|nr:DUF5663 domain-containing protein [Candidatus Saccharimonadales bacterium]